MDTVKFKIVLFHPMRLVWSVKQDLQKLMEDANSVYREKFVLSVLKTSTWEKMGFAIQKSLAALNTIREDAHNAKEICI